MAGFVIDNPGKYLIRAVGPGLVQFGVQNTMINPELKIYRGQVQIGGNSEWHVGAGVSVAMYLDYQARAGAFPLPTGSLDAAYIIDLPVGAYTAHVAEFRDRGGDVLIEIYEIPPG